MPQTVIVEVSEQGDTTVTAQGVRGSGCRALTEAIERSIGATVADRNTPEMHQTQQQQIRAGQ